MPAWSSQRYEFEGKRQGISPDVLEAAIQVFERIQSVDPRLPPVLTLRHFSALTDTPYGYLRRVASRTAGNYKRVLFKKKVPGRSRYREIHIPEEPLLMVQQWIANRILRNTKSHSASFAYHPNSQPVFAATQHCGCKWLLKVDIEDFFHSISERMVYSAFKELGYARLLCFELARITTMVSPAYQTEHRTKSNKWIVIPSYKHAKEGFLPQGAPTSPMLSNLVMKRVDEQLASLAKSCRFKYTRYADDLAFSTDENITSESIKQFKQLVNSILLRKGFKPNRRKTVIRGPGARRIVLGILVDSPNPRLAKEYKNMLRQHLYYLSSPVHGPSKHADERNISVSTLYHHVRGKIAWAERIEPGFGYACLAEFKSINWPPLDIDRIGGLKT